MIFCNSEHGEIISCRNVSSFRFRLDQSLTHRPNYKSHLPLFIIIYIKAVKTSYQQYIIGYLKELYSVPWTAALTNITNNENLFEQIKNKLKFPEDRDIIPCNVSQKDDVRNIILSIK